MKPAFYSRLACGGILKNRKTYLPYIITCIIMVMVHYIVSFLTVDENIARMRGGDILQSYFGFGIYVIGLFSLVFLFYTNSFLIRRRKKEFGLYNVLGMNKRNILKILLWESGIVAGISLLGGLSLGVLLSKAAELLMMKMLGWSVTFHFAVSLRAAWGTAALFLIIFFLILLNSLRQIQLSKPIELIKSETVGEKPPKANWLGAVLGILLLSVAYYIAVVIDDPVNALVFFFIAVILVIIATYLLFISGSVTLCRFLQKIKRYYYKTNHFVSVSSMVYRMKKNGAGLASICILCTMVLVILSSTTCLYVGIDSSLQKRYPRDITLRLYGDGQEETEAVHTEIEKILAQNGQSSENSVAYRFLPVGAYLAEDEVIFDRDRVNSNDYTKVRELFFLTIEEYNRVMHTDIKLEEQEILLYCTRTDYTYDTIAFEGCGRYAVKKTDSFKESGFNAGDIVSNFYIFASENTVEKIYQAQKTAYELNASEIQYYYGFDLSCNDDTQREIKNQIAEEIEKLQEKAKQQNILFPGYSIASLAEKTDEALALNGGFFFLGLFLGGVFIVAAVMIIYYKQITEGYEDQQRFDILQKVGMTGEEIRSSINSQVLTVFFLPLIAAGIHVAFAFKMISQLMLLFGITNTTLLAIITAACFAVFAVFYIIVYLITSRSYYYIVRRKEV